MDDYIIRMKGIPVLKIAFKVRLLMYSRNIKTLLHIVHLYMHEVVIKLNSV